MNQEVFAVDAELVIETNRKLCELSGENHALLDGERLEGAIERPWSGSVDEEFFPSLYDKAAALLHALASRQVFENGNKRTAWVAAVSFLDANGVDIGWVDPSHANMFVRAVAVDHNG